MTDDSAWPSGPAGYDKLMKAGNQTHGVGGDLQRERDAVIPLIAPDEKVVGRHYASFVSADAVGDFHGAVFLSSDRRLLMVTAKGALRKKFNVMSLGYGTLKPGIADVNEVRFGNPVWISGFSTKTGETFLVEFLSEVDKNRFVQDIGGALGGWNIVHGEG